MRHATELPDPAASPPRPRVPLVVRRVTEMVFALLARLRRARPFHPRGASFTATLEPLAGGPLPFLGADVRPALVRLSHSAGLPRRFPDVYGLALRIPDGAGPGQPQDFLLASSSRAPLGRHLLTPARGFDTAHYSSLLFYRHAGGLRLVGARHHGPPVPARLRLADLEAAAEQGRLVFDLLIASPAGAWQRWGRLAVGEKLPAVTSRRLRFHPWHTATALRPAGPLNHLRAPAYDAAQRTATSE